MGPHQIFIFIITERVLIAINLKVNASLRNSEKLDLKCITFGKVQGQEQETMALNLYTSITNKRAYLNNDIHEINLNFGRLLNLFYTQKDPCVKDYSPSPLLIITK